MQLMQGSTWRGRAAGVVFGALALCGVAAADTICVPDDYDTIQEAIDAATDGDEICVAPGTYNETINFIGKAVRLYSTDGPEVTVIDADGLSASVVTCDSGEGPETILEGFKITGGEQHWSGGGILVIDGRPTMIGCVFADNRAERKGGGVYLFQSSPVFKDCVWRQNSADQGGGFYAVGNSQAWSRPDFENCRFDRNSADHGGGAYLGLYTSSEFVGCAFIENSAEAGAGGGVVSGVGASAKFDGCLFQGNAASHDGGGAKVRDRPKFMNCVFSGNTAARGAAMFTMFDTTPFIVACEFSGNVARNTGGGIYNRDEASRPRVEATYFCNNLRGHIQPPGTWDDLGGNRFDSACCIADLDSTGMVGLIDIEFVLAAWGRRDAPEDLDHSGTVDFDDLLIVLDSWGPCE